MRRPRNDARERLFKAVPDATHAWRAPGRANLIGEHTDYNDGFALPVALDQATYIAGRRRDDRVVLRSLDLSGVVEIALDALEDEKEGWGRYPVAVARALVDEGVEVCGFEGTVASDVPSGSGLSSSAALEVAVSFALAGRDLTPLERARVCRRAENDHVGVRSGILDQLASTAAQPGHALLMDCRAETVEHVPVPDTMRVLVIDSGVTRGLDDSGYNERREQCEAAVRSLRVESLREVGPDDLAIVRERAGETVWRRARHVVTENARVLAAADALRQGDLQRLGHLFAESHRSMVEDFEISTPEIDQLVALAVRTEGVVAARLTGGGFGGCTVNLVEGDTADRAAAWIVEAYGSETGRRGRAWVTTPGEGAGMVGL